ncbi:MAG: hypothetical protein ACPG4X_14560 [Pikeienuella sp.]
MTESLTPDSAPTTENEATRDEIIVECANEMNRINAERKDLNDAASDVRERLRDIGFDPKALENVQRLQGMEQEARNKFMEDTKRIYDALEIGGELDWVSAVAEATEAEQVAA